MDGANERSAQTFSVRISRMIGISIRRVDASTVNPAIKDIAKTRSEMVVVASLITSVWSMIDRAQRRDDGELPSSIGTANALMQRKHNGLLIRIGQR